MPSDPANKANSYSPPTLKKLTLEQAKQILAKDASCGDQAADLLQLLEQEFQERQRLLDAD